MKKTVQKDASLHEKAVQQAEANIKAMEPVREELRRTSQRAAAHVRVSYLYTTHGPKLEEVVESVRTHAVRLAAGDLRRLDILDAETVVVRNPIKD